MENYGAANLSALPTPSPSLASLANQRNICAHNELVLYWIIWTGERKRGQGARIASWIDEVAAGHSRRHTKSISCFALSKSIWVWLTCQSCSHKNRTENSQQNFVRWKRTNKQNFNRIIVGVSLVQCGQGGTRLGLQLLRKRKLCGASVFCYLGISCVCMCVSFIRSNKSKIYIQTHAHWDRFLLFAIHTTYLLLGEPLVRLICYIIKSRPPQHK